MPSHEDLTAPLARAVAELAKATGLPVAFGGPVSADGRDLVIEHLVGTSTQSLARLRVTTGAGLGGKALALARPSTVADYLRAEGITHRYDQAVAPERLCAVLALPVRVGQDTRAVLYAAARQPTSLGDRRLRAAVEVVGRCARDLLVEQEIRRRLRDDPAAGLSARETEDLSAELAAIAGTITDPAARDKLLAVCRRVRARSADAADRRPVPGGPTLTPREAELLAHVARGRTNDEIAAALGLLPNTVKSYLKHAMRKLGAANRIQALNRAREWGLLD
ncbi:MAG TPA: LuxR C-terminal-related transcriptional regulator [Pseudonocardiaceae bacterium]|nr:LuxR C-terminal-related transcriptional regulator [Pseudonocardiaceae bacterium]